MKWFTAKAKAGNPKAAHITIDGEIGESWWDDAGTSSQAFMSAVKALGDVTEITLDLNSPGGAVSDGITMANYLRQHQARVTVNVLGQASSIASVIAMAGDEVNMGLGSWMLVHQPWTVALGNADQLRALAGDLDTLNESIMAHYLARAGQDKRDEMAGLIKGDDGEGTILTANQALALGLADSVMNEVKAAASMTGLAKAMAHGAEQARAKLSQQSQPPKSLTAADALALAFDMTPEEAEAQAADLGDQIIALRQQPPAITADYLRENHASVVDELQMAAVKKHDICAADMVAAERTRVVAIVKACQTTGQTQLLDKLIDNGMSETQASEYIYDVAAASGNRHSIHNSHSPEGGHKAVINYNKVYARQNRTKATA